MQNTVSGPSFRAHLFSDRRIAAMFGLGFSTGIPYLLVYVTQAAWLSEVSIPLATIGILSELTLAYKFKFLWAPFLDEYDAPFFSKRLGRRRGWIIISQIAVALTLTGIAFGDPAHSLSWTIAFSLALGVAGATQDVVVDGWRITVAPRDMQAMMSSCAEMGYRIGILCAGAGALFIADYAGWRIAYLVMACLMLPGMIAALMAPEPVSDLERPGQKHSFLATIILPVRDLTTRLGIMALPVFVLIAGFRMPGYISNAMAMPLFKHLNYTDTQIATVTKLFGFGVGLAGVFLASYMVPRLGMMVSLLIGTIAASASHLSLAWLASHGGEFWAFALAVSIDNFAASFASIVLITFMSSLVSAELAASQYALMTSLCALPGSILAGFSGFLIEKTGFERFFVMTSLIGVPVALLCLYVWHRRENLPQVRSTAD